MSGPTLPVIGLVELVSLPDWGIVELPAKVDSGARTSALDVEGLTLEKSLYVRFVVVLDPRLGGRRQPVRAELVRRAWVRGSSGSLHERLFVKTRMRLGSLERSVEVGLVGRGDMRFRMLLGRSAFEHQFVVDVGRSFVLGGVPTD